MTPLRFFSKQRGIESQNHDLFNFMDTFLKDVPCDEINSSLVIGKAVEYLEANPSKHLSNLSVVMSVMPLISNIQDATQVHFLKMAWAIIQKYGSFDQKEEVQKIIAPLNEQSLYRRKEHNN